MNPLEVEDILKTFRIIIDNREHQTAKAKRRYKSFGVPTQKATLDYGDYCWNATIDDSPRYDISGRVAPACCIERKMSLDELAMCFTSGRRRFKREFERAKKNGARMYLLVENGSWEGIILHRYRSKFHPHAFLASLAAWMVRYRVPVIFCKEETSGKLIREILYRDLKEQLEGADDG